MRNLVTLIEQAESTLTVYHGSDSDISRFNLDYLKDGRHEHGIGVYFSYDINTAEHYGKHVYRVTLPGNLNLIPDRPPNRDIALKLIHLSPELDDRLTDWDEDQERALGMLLNSVVVMAENYADMIDSIWYELFRNHERFYLEQVVNLTGYQGKMIHWEDDEPFLVLYDVDAIINVEKQR